MIISIIAAMGKGHQIGYNGSLPWRIRDDLKMFSAVTSNHTLLMGRKTFDSIGGKPLPNRTNIVVSQNTNFKPNGCLVYSNIETAVESAKQMRSDELFVCGGSSIYKYFIENNLVGKMYLTFVEYDGVGDTFFPEINLKDWHLISEIDFVKNQNNEYNAKFCVFSKKF